MLLLAIAGILGQSSAPPEATGADSAIIIIGVLVVTAVIATVVIRRSKR